MSTHVQVPVPVAPSSQVPCAAPLHASLRTALVPARGPGSCWPSRSCWPSCRAARPPQITITEVNMARVFNHDVKVRRAAKEKAEKEGVEVN